MEDVLQDTWVTRRRRTVHRLLGLCTPALVVAWTCNASAAPASGAGVLEQLAARAEFAVVAPDLAALHAHARPVLLWAGLSFPTLQPGVVGVLRGGDATVQILDPQAPPIPGLAPGVAVAVLHFEFAPSPVLAAAVPSGAPCLALRAALHGGAPEHAAAWESRGACLVAVGECGRHSCGPMGVPAPGKPNAVAAWLAALDGVRLVASRSWLLGVLGPRAGAALEGVTAVAARLETSGPHWAIAAATFFKAPPVEPSALEVLPDAVWGSASPVAELTFHTPPDAKGRWKRARAPMLRGLGTVGSNPQDRALWGGGPWALDWRGLDVTNPAAGERWFGNVLAAHQAVPDAAQQARCVAWVERQATAAGLKLDAGLWTDGRRTMVAAVAPEGRCSVLTQAAAERGLPTGVVSGTPRGTRLRVRVHGRRLLAALRRVGLLESGGVPQAQAAVAAAELLGPSLERLDDVTLHAWPAPGGTTWEAVVSLDVRGPAR